MKKGIQLGLIFALVIIVAVGILIAYTFTEHKENDMEIKTNKQAILSSFPNLGDFKKCYWKEDVMGQNVNDRVPGPSTYWLKCFVEVDIDKINIYINKYKMKEIDNGVELDFLPKNFDAKASQWFFSSEFNDFIKKPYFFGEVYIDRGNCVIYFDVISN